MLLLDCLFLVSSLNLYKLTNRFCNAFTQQNVHLMKSKRKCGKKNINLAFLRLNEDFIFSLLNENVKFRRNGESVEKLFDLQRKSTE